MEDLLKAWPYVAARLRHARKLLFLSDFDGTLTPIVERPEWVSLQSETRRLLANLNMQKHMRLGIISGRALSDLMEKVGIPGLIYAGNHGLEISGPGISFVNPVADEFKPVLRVIHYILSQSLESIRGVFVENKGLTLSVHYRMAEERKITDVERKVMRIVRAVELAGKTRMTSGKKVFEVRPSVKWDKGRAIKLLMKKYGKGGRRSGLVPLYMGDDVTDEDGFRAIENYGNGVSILVGPPSNTTCARYNLKSPCEVNVFLEMLERLVQSAPETHHVAASMEGALEVENPAFNN